MSMWENDMIQFARLIAELESIGAFNQPVIDGLMFAMDLSTEELFEIIDRAQLTWDKSVRENC